MRAEITALNNEVSELKKKRSLDDKSLKRIEFLERSERYNTLIIEGIKLNPDKSLKENVIEEVYKLTGYMLYISDFRSISRFVTEDDGTVKSVKCKFFNPELKVKLMRRKGRLRGSEVYFNELLTDSQKEIYDEA